MAQAYNTIVLCLSHYMGGMELDTVKMVAGLNHHQEPTLLVCKSGSFVAGLAAEQRLAFEEVSFTTTFSPSIIFRLRSLLRSSGANNLIFLGTSEIKSIYFALLGMPHVNFVVRYGTTRSSSKKDVFHRLLYSRVNRHLCISQHIRRNVEQVIPVGRDSTLDVIYTSTEFTPVRPGGRSDGGRLAAIHIGRIVRGKGQLDAIQALAGTDMNLTLLGSVEERDYRDEIDDTIQKLRLTDQVVFAGFQRQPQRFLDKADIFLFPSHGEGLSNALIEALGHGLICIVYDNTVFPEFVTLGFHLHLVEHGNIVALQKTLRDIRDNISEERRLAALNIDKARRLFDQALEFERLKAILR